MWPKSDDKVCNNTIPPRFNKLQNVINAIMTILNNHISHITTNNFSFFIPDKEGEGVGENRIGFQIKVCD